MHRGGSLPLCKRNTKSQSYRSNQDAQDAAANYNERALELAKAKSAHANRGADLTKAKDDKKKAEDEVVLLEEQKKQLDKDWGEILPTCIIAGSLYRAGAETTPNFRETFRVSPRTILKKYLAVGTQTCDPRVPLQRSKLENQENDIFGVKKCLFWGVPLWKHLNGLFWAFNSLP